MYKLEKLSGLEQKLYFLLEAEDKRIVNARVAMELLKISRMHAYNLLKNMHRKGALDKVKANLYARIPAHIVHDKGEYVEDPILVAMHIAEPYFLSYYTALTLHGLAQQVTRNYYFSTTKHVSRVEYHGNRIQPVILTRRRFFGFEEKEYEKEVVVVSDLERTIVDVIDRAEYAGGYEEVLRCLMDVEGVDWDRLIGYAGRMGEKILLHRLGYVFELIREQANTPDSFLRKLEAMLSSNVYYFEAGRKGRFNERWRVIVDPRLERAVRGA